MPLTPDETLRFLRSVHPYYALPEAALTALAPRFNAVSVAAGDPV